MSLRCYLPTNAAFPAANPQPATAGDVWERIATGAFGQHRLMTAKNTIETNTNEWFSLFGATTTSDSCWKQFVSDPLDGDQTLSGNLTCVFLCEELSAAENAFLAVAVQLVRANGTRVTVGFGNGAVEFVTPAATRTLVVALTTTAMQDGDRLAVEVGVHGVTPANTASIGIVFGAPSNLADLALVSGSTLNGVSWVEFSLTLYFKTGTFLGLRDPDGLLGDWKVNVTRDSFQRQPDDVRGSEQRSAAGNMLSTLRTPKARFTCSADFATPDEALSFRRFLAPSGARRKLILFSDRSGALRGDTQIFVWVTVGVESAIYRQLSNGSYTQLWTTELTLAEA